MDAIGGVDFFLDVHGDESMPYNFISGISGIPCFDSRLRYLQASGTATRNHHARNHHARNHHACVTTARNQPFAGLLLRVL